ncbi:hypothetical protein Trisim1_011052 [Trichoderma cf. simile WF8]
MSIIIEEFHIDAELLSTLHEASEEDLQALAELYEDPANDDQIELYIYLCFLIFQKSRNTQSLDQAIQRAEGWAAATAASHPDHDRRYRILDTLVVWGYESRAIEEDVEAFASLELGESGTDTTDTLGLPLRLLGEASRLSESFDQTGRLECLNDAIEKIELAINMSGEYTTIDMLNNFGVALGTRFRQTGSTDDLNQAISILGEVVDATPHNDPQRAGYLSNLGIQLKSRFEQKGSIEDLNQAISILSEAVDVMPHDHSFRAGCLCNLGAGLSQRFDWMESIDDLDRALDVAREAVNLTPHNHPDHFHYLANYGAALGKRFRRTESIDDLNQAISTYSEVVDAMPHGHPDRATAIGNLGSFFSMRSKHTGSIDDLNQAISYASKAVDTLPYDHPDRAGRLHSLGMDFKQRFCRERSVDDYNRALSLLSKAVDITPLDDRNRASYLRTLAFCIAMGDGQKRLPNDEHWNCALPLLITSWHSETLPAHERIKAAFGAAGILFVQKEREQSYQLLQEAISLLHTMSPRFSNRADAQALLTYSSGWTTLAVSVARMAGKAPEDALRILEHGRGIIASLLMDMRGDITDLQSQYPDLAEKFSLLRDELDLPSHNTASPASIDKFSSRELQISRHREANREFSHTINTIRAQPGFANFLQPPDVKEFMGAAEQGPIIILSLRLSLCNAFLIQPDSIQVIDLPGLSEDDVRQRVTGLLGNSDLSHLLEWLWHIICQPCLDALGIKDAVSNDNWPHIWWIPTGLLSQLPLHAAGIYKQGSKETVLDRAVSSYASSIKALLHGRKHGIRKPRQPPSEGSALIVSMQETPGLGERGRLPFAADEVHMLRDLCPQLQLAPITPSRNKEGVLKHMPKFGCRMILHF